jgi:transposase-like protein
MIELEYKYYECIKKWEDRYELRLKLVQDAIAHGIKPTARKYGTTVKTVRKWVKRYEADKKAGLEERSRKPQRSPQATKPWVRFKLIHEAQQLQ